MGAAKDYRALVPRTPPEGLLEWTRETCSKLGRHGLIYEVAYDDEDLFWPWPMALSEGHKKTKMVRVTCSCCGQSILLDWAKDEAHGYGFIHLDDQEGDWARTVTAAGDESTCPMCEEKVLVNKRAAVRDHYVTAECQVMSAGVLEGGELVLTGWTAQRRVYKSGYEHLELLPAEAYVFTPTDCAQLMGWRNGYSGNGGYFIQYSSQWRQPKNWIDRWGQTERIFGLTAELIDGCCLPHCKLDVYMEPRVGAMHYPVAWLRLYQIHPNAEAVLLHGLPRVLDDLIDVELVNFEKTVMCRMSLPQIDWTQTRPAQMLRLTKEELRMGRDQDWGRLFWELFVGTKRAGERLTEEDIRAAFCLGDEHVDALIPHGQVGKSIRYLLRQCELLGLEGEDEDPAPYGVPDVQLLLDYWDMSEKLGRDLSDSSVKYPADLIAAHDRASELMRQRELEAAADRFRVRRRVLKKYSYAAHGLMIRPAVSQRELTAEGDALHHCVGTYGERYAAGKTAIFFIRRTSRPKEPYYTLELDEKKLEVRQNRGLRNCARTPEVEAFENEWLAWVRSGAPRGRDNRPLRMERDTQNVKQGKGAA